MRAVVALALILGLGGGVCHARGGQRKRPPRPAAVADQVVAAVESKDEKALAALAASAAPDPWLVVDELSFRKAHDAAVAFAKAIDRKSVGRLVAYAESRREVDPDQADREVLAAMTTAVRGRKPKAALEAFDNHKAKGALDSVIRLRMAYARARALRSMRRAADAAGAFTELAEAANALGWLQRAADGHHQAGLIGYHTDDYRYAVTAWTKRLAVARAMEDPNLVGGTLNNIGIAQNILGDNRSAVKSYGEALRIAREMKDAPGEAAALNNLGISYREMSRFDDAMTAYEAALKIKRAEDDLPGVANTLNNMGMIDQARGHHERALERYGESLRIDEELKNDEQRAQTLNNVGIIQQLLGDHLGALKTYATSLALAKRFDDKRGIANTINNVGIAHEALGDYDLALAKYKESAQLKTAIGDLAGLSKTHMNFASVYQSLGRYADSLRHSDEALRIARKIGDPKREADIISNLSVVKQSLGALDEAVQHAEEALASAQKIGIQLTVASAHGNLGNLLLERGAHEKALERYRAALAIFRKVGEKQGVAESLSSIGLVLQRTGQLADSIKKLDEARAIAVEAGEAAVVARVLSNLGHSQRVAGQLDAAMKQYDEALTVLDRSPSPATLASVLWGMANVHLAKGDTAAAVRAARAGVESVVRIATGLAEGEGAGTRETFVELFDVGMRASARANDLDSLLWFLEQGRAGALREGLGGRAGVESAVLSPVLRKELSTARAAEQRALSAYRHAVSGGDQAVIDAKRARWHDTTKDVERVLARIQRDEKAAAGVMLPAPDGLAAIQKRLGAGDALVLYGLSSDEALALVITHDDARLRRLGPSASIHEAIGALRPSATEAQVQARIVRLRALLAEPLALDGAVSRVLVSPMGRLGFVPFSAVFPERDVSHVPSGTTLGLLQEGAPAAPGAGVLALGDPIPPSESKATTSTYRSAERELGRLPGSRLEVNAVGTERLLGDDATEAGLRKALAAVPRWRSVHFACHGLLDPDRPMRSALVLTADEADDGLLTCLEVLRSRVPSDLVVLSACDTARGRVYRTEGVLGLARAFMYAGAPRVICSLWRVDDEAAQVLMKRFYELWNPATGDAKGAAAALRAAQAHVRAVVREVEDEAASARTGRRVVKRVQPWSHPRHWAAWALWGLAD